MGRIRNALGALLGRTPESDENRRRWVRARFHPKSEFVRGFDMGETDNIFPSSVGSAAGINADIFAHNQTMRKRARYEAQNMHQAKRVLNEFKRQVVGAKGIQLRPKYLDQNGRPDKRDRDLVLSSWREWGKAGNCDVTGRLSWTDIQALVLKTLIRDGECLIRKVPTWRNNQWAFAVQVLEVDRMNEHDVRELPNGNNVLMGVEVDEWMRPHAYHLSEPSPTSTLWAPSAYPTSGKTMRLAADEVLHIFIQERAEQLRGYTHFHAAFRLMHLQKGYEEAEVVAMRAAANKLGIIVSPGGNAYGGDDEDEDGTILVDSEPGGFDQVPHGTEIKSWDPQHPNANAPAFLEHIARSIGASLDCNYHRLTGDLKNASFSSMKHGQVNDADIFGELQGWLAEHLCRPIYEAWLDQSVLAGALPFPARKRSKYLEVNWQGPALAWADPEKEAKAARINIGIGAQTLTELASQRGRSLEDLLEERADELEQARRLGLDIDISPQAALMGAGAGGMSPASLDAIVSILEKVSGDEISEEAATVLLGKLGIEPSEAAELLADLGSSGDD